MPVRIRLGLLFALVTAILIAAGGFVFVSKLTASLRGSLAATLQVRAAATIKALPEGDTGDHKDSGGGPRTVPVRAVRSCLTPGVDSLSQVIGPAGTALPQAGTCSGRPLLAGSGLAAARRATLVTEAQGAQGAAPMLLYAEPVRRQPGTVVITGASLSTVDAAAWEVTKTLAIVGPITVLLAGLAAWLLAGAALAPVTRMRRQAAEMSARDQDAFLSVPRSRDEIAALASTLNGLLARLQGALSQQRGFVASAGHELRTPLSALRAELELADHPDRTRADLAAAIRAATADTDRIIRLAENLLLLARSDDGRPVVALRTMSIGTVLGPCAAGFAGLAAGQGATIASDVPDGLMADLDELRFRQVADNLLANALRFSPPGSTVLLRARSDGPAVLIEVLDEGPGFPAEFLPRAFDRFSRPDHSRSRQDGGAGLGLAIARALVEAHHGTVAVGNRPGGGAWARVVLPGPGSANSQSYEK
ncbi:MAG: sensor histidine kinase [Streptosporangiaceae bacterium]